ncbi:MAG: DoxX family protein [Filimonas sp.]|nr:DoxX family protein [Filimonas sp.]
MNQNQKITAFLLARLAAGVSMLGHGLVRLPKLTGFSQWMQDVFKDSMLPAVLVTPFSYALPIIEFISGLLLVLGLFTRFAAVLGAAAMIALLFGSCMVEKWDWIPPQLIHVAFFCTLIIYEKEYNSYALDKVVKK